MPDELLEQYKGFTLTHSKNRDQLGLRFQCSAEDGWRGVVADSRKSAEHAQQAVLDTLKAWGF